MRRLGPGRASLLHSMRTGQRSLED
ncbi:hypothetical protein A2U01_0111216, partial [Trifolium medium]|nr:hypothetical protein [Trifolium medium]